MTAFGERTVAAARKEHACVACGAAIDKGTSYVRWTGLNDGALDSVAYHPECREAEIAWNQHLGTFADDWQSLMLNRDRDDDLWLSEKHPRAAERLGIVRLP